MSAFRDFRDMRWANESPDTIGQETSLSQKWIAGLLWALIGALVVVACVLKVNEMAWRDQQLEARHSCDMVHLWLTDKAAGIEPLNRRGWPAQDQWERDHCK